MLSATVDEKPADLYPSVIAAARGGDRKAFEALVVHVDPQMRDLAWRLLGDRRLMDDVLQTAYLKAMRAIGGFRGEAAIATWFYRIVYNACVDEIGRERRTALVPLEEAADVADGSPDPAGQLDRRAALAAAFSGLSLEQRAAVVLVDQEGYDYGSAADILGVPVGTLGSRLAHARATLRAALGTMRAAEEEA
jgi:RNA polymerase sigma-70 factor, ECF subfamily